MSAEIINLIKSEIDKYSKKIDQLYAAIGLLAGEKSDETIPGIEEYPDNEPKVSAVIKNPGKKIIKPAAEKPKNKYYTPKPKNQPAGTMKFCDYLLKIFSSKRDKKFNSKEAAEIMGKAISDNKIFPAPSKDLQSNTTAYLWYYLQRGKLIKEETEGGKALYQYSENVPGEKSEKQIKPVKKTESISHTEGSGNLEEKIMEIIRKEKKISLPNLVLKIQRSEDYLEISKNLTGTLAKCAEDILRDFVAREILEWTDNNEYCIDNRGDF